MNTLCGQSADGTHSYGSDETGSVLMLPQDTWDTNTKGLVGFVYIFLVQ